MLKRRAGQFHSLIQSLDVALCASVFVVTYGMLRSGEAFVSASGDVSELLAMGLAASLVWPLTLGRLDVYDSNRRRSLWFILSRLAFASAAAMSLLFCVTFVLRPDIPIAFPVVCGLAQFSALASVRIAIFSGLRLLRRVGKNFRTVLIVGSGPRARRVKMSIDRHPEWGLRIAGYVDDESAPALSDLDEEVHKLVELPRLLSEFAVNEVIVACPRSMLGMITPVVQVCASTGVPITLLSDLFGDFLPPPKVTKFDTAAALSFAPVHHGLIKLAVKRAVDVVGAALLLVLLAPVLIAAAIAIHATSRGGVLYRQIRCGLHGRPFEMLKLRTMCADAEHQQLALLDRNEADGPVFKIAADPRVTWVGRFLRRSSLDEVPQLWNVIKGEMSLVGPRPPMPGEVAQYETAERRRLSMRPGLTCLWQVNGRSKIGFEDWVKLDVEYIDTWSLFNDLKLLLKTIPAVLRGTGAS